jgi:amidase
LPLDPAVREVLNSARPVFESLGCHVDDACPDFSDAEEVFKDLRAFGMTPMADMMREHRAQMKPEAIWNIEAGLKLSAEDVSRAMVRQGAIFQRMSQFMERYDAFVCAVNQVPPFAIDIAYPTEIDGEKMETYIDWMRSAYYVTVTRMPAISVPAGFTPDGLPVGIQIVGKFRGDLELLKIAYAFEQATRHGEKRPPIVSE